MYGREDVREAGSGQFIEGLESHNKELGFYSKVSGKTLEGFQQGSDMMHFAFKKYPGSCV